MGVAPCALESAIIFRRYHPNVRTVSRLPVTALSMSSDSSPTPGSEPRAADGCSDPGSALMGLPSLGPNWMMTKSPGFTLASNLSQ